MSTMTRKRKKDADDQPSEPLPPSLSRKNTKYIGIPAEMYEALDRYRLSKSDEDEEKSMSWAGRHAVRKFLESVGFWPPPQTPQK